MNLDEKTRFEKMEKSVELIQADVTEIKSALLGNHLSGDKGLTGRIDVLATKQDIQEAQMKLLIEDKIKNAIYIKLINWLLVVIGSGIITAVIAIVFK